MENATLVNPEPVGPPWSGRPRLGDMRSPLSLRESLILLGLLVAVTVATFGSVVLAIVAIPAVRDVALAVLAVTIPVHATLLLLVIHVALRRAGTTWSALGFTRPTPRLLHLLWQIPVVFTAIVAAQALAFAVLGGSGTSETDGAESWAADLGAVAVISVFVGTALMTPLWEEAIFRGIIHGGLRKRFGWISATFLSALVFAAAHGVPFLLPYMLTLGVALALLGEFHRTLWAPVIMHMILNGLVSGAVLSSVL